MTSVYLLLTGKFGRRTLLLAGTTLTTVGTVCFAALIHSVFHDPVIAAGCHDSAVSSNVTTPAADQYDTTHRS